MKNVRSAVLALVTAGAVLAPAAAYAGSEVTSDAKGDILFIDGASDSETPVADPTRVEGDVVSSAVSLSARRVTMAMHFRELTMTGDGFYAVFRVRTNEGRFREVDVIASPRHWSGTTHTLNAGGTEVRCRGVRHNIYYTSNLVRVSIPSRCLSRPRWVEAGLGAITVTGSKFFADDANTDGHVGDEPKWGTRVYR